MACSISLREREGEPYPTAIAPGRETGNTHRTKTFSQNEAANLQQSALSYHEECLSHDNVAAEGSHCSFRLLSLPAEIRNKIYDYALFDPIGVICRFNGDNKWVFLSNASNNKGSVPTMAHEHNQLRYVSKQLHAETLGSILNNDLIFESGIIGALYLLRVLPAVQLARPLSIVLKERFKPNESAAYFTHPSWRVLEDMYKTHKKLNITVSLPYDKSHQWNFHSLLSLAYCARPESGQAYLERYMEAADSFMNIDQSFLTFIRNDILRRAYNYRFDGLEKLQQNVRIVLDQDIDLGLLKGSHSYFARTSFWIELFKHMQTKGI